VNLRAGFVWIAMRMTRVSNEEEKERVELIKLRKSK